MLESNAAARALKRLLKTYAFPAGVVRTVLAGPLRGMQVRISERTGWSVLYGGWEPAAQRVYRELVSSGAVVYDLGANTGLHTLLFARLAGPAGQVVAFEPLPANAEDLEETLRLNRISNVEVRRVAAGNQDGFAELKLGIRPTQGSLVGIGCETGETLTVRVARLDTLIGQGTRPPDFVKIDIEGAEADALAGLEQTAARYHPTIALDLHTPEQDRRCGAFFARLGYQVYRMDRNRGRFRSHAGLLTAIARLDRPWPDPAGIWGAVLAVHPARVSPAQLQALVR